MGNYVENRVYTFNHYLQIVGQLNGIAPGEKVKSARFVGQRLYLVTFRYVDPFFVIDLSDHSNPRILGQLKVEGFSTYLHPYN